MAGDTCNTTGFLCESASSALECRVGKWVSLPCKGTAGCKREGETVKCDMSGNVEGDACASSAEGKGMCTADGKATLECRTPQTESVSKMVKTHDCRTCSIVDGNVKCTPQ